MPKRLTEMGPDERNRAILASALRGLGLDNRQLGRALGLMRRVNGDPVRVMAACVYAKRNHYPISYAAGCLHRGASFDDRLLADAKATLDHARDEIVLTEGGSGLSLLKGIGSGET